jgi:hypothetical protein
MLQVMMSLVVLWPGVMLVYWLLLPPRPPNKVPGRMVLPPILLMLLMLRLHGLLVSVRLWLWLLLIRRDLSLLLRILSMLLKVVGLLLVTLLVMMVRRSLGTRCVLGGVAPSVGRLRRALG